MPPIIGKPDPGLMTVCSCGLPLAALFDAVAIWVVIQFHQLIVGLLIDQ
jgi:hypothetical protein